MYFVDRGKIEHILSYMEENIQYYENQKNWVNPIERLALERITHTLVESVLDVGNHMIDGFIMRDPGSYEDIIDILEDEKVVEKKVADELREIIRLRKVLVQAYTEVEHQHLLEVMDKNLEGLKTFPEFVRKYLLDELGPVSAFLPNE